MKKIAGIALFSFFVSALAMAQTNELPEPSPVSEDQSATVTAQQVLDNLRGGNQDPWMTINFLENIRQDVLSSVEKEASEKNLTVDEYLSTQESFDAFKKEVFSAAPFDPEDVLFVKYLRLNVRLLLQETAKNVDSERAKSLKSMRMLVFFIGYQIGVI